MNAKKKMRDKRCDAILKNCCDDRELGLACTAALEKEARIRGVLWQKCCLVACWHAVKNYNEIIQKVGICNFFLGGTHPSKSSAKAPIIIRSVSRDSLLRFRGGQDVVDWSSGLWFNVFVVVLIASRIDGLFSLAKYLFNE